VSSIGISLPGSFGSPMSIWRASALASTKPDGCGRAASCTGGRAKLTVRTVLVRLPVTKSSTGVISPDSVSPQRSAKSMLGSDWR
jgi:hypothetical protein